LKLHVIGNTAVSRLIAGLQTNLSLFPFGKTFSPRQSTYLTCKLIEIFPEKQIADRHAKPDGFVI
jgi:hypothetical protein